MPARYVFAALVALGLNVSALAATQVGGAVTPVCDLACMTGTVDRYLAAVVKPRSGGPALNRDVKFTENTARHQGGRRAVGGRIRGCRPDRRIYAVDVGAGRVGFYGVMKERDRPLIIALRLKLVNGPDHRDRAHPRAQYPRRCAEESDDAAPRVRLGRENPMLACPGSRW